MRHQTRIISEVIKSNARFLTVLITGLATLTILATRSLSNSYREGLGESETGTGLLLFFATIVAGFIVFLLLVICTITERRRNSLKISISKILCSAAVLFLSTTYISYLPYLPREPGYIQYTKGFLERVDRECNEHELRQWALNFMEANRHKPSRDYVRDIAHIPEFVKDIYPFSGEPEFRWTVTEVNGHECLSIYWGGALPGHWGLSIGQSTFRDLSDETHYTIEWKPGIYVWHSIQ